MSKSIDTLDKAVNNVIKDASGKSISKDQLVEIIDNNISFLRQAGLFFTNLGDDGAKLKKYLDSNLKNNSLKSVQIYNAVCAGLNSASKRAMEQKFLGAFADTLTGLAVILNSVCDNINVLFADKQITVYNTKISQVAIFGMIDNARIFSQYVFDYIALFMSDRNADLLKPAKYTLSNLDSNLGTVIEVINRTIGGNLSKSFVNAIKKYKASGVDVTVVNGGTSSAQFARVNSEVTDNDIQSGARGLRIFKLIGDWLVNISDTKRRKLMAERDVLDARVQLLQLELNGVDPDSPEYKRWVTIIKNYQALLDRLNAKLAKYEED